jgi:hypothetical protein
MELTGTPQWLRTRPLMLTALLVFKNQLRRQRFDHVTLLLAIAACILLILGTLVIAQGSDYEKMVAALNRSGSSIETLVLLALAASSGGALFTSSRLRRTRERLRRSWLAGTVHVNALSFAQCVVVAIWPIVVFLILLISVAMGLHLDANMTGPLPLAGALCAGALPGILIGLLTAVTHPRSRQQRSRFASRQAGASSLTTSSAIDSGALAHWPIQEAKAMSAPANSRLLLLIALVTLPGGMSGVFVIAILAAWVLCGWLITLLFALHNTVRDARVWLASTQVSRGRLTIPTVTRVIRHHLAGLAAIGSLLLLVDTSPNEVMHFVMTWVSLAAIFTCIILWRGWNGHNGNFIATLATLLVLTYEQTQNGIAAVMAIIAICILWKTRSALARA